MPKMSVNAETLETPKPVPSGRYKLRLKGMTIKKSPKGHNIEAYLTTVEQPSETNDKFVLYRMNNGFSQGEAMQELSHGLGFAMDINADGTASLPGDWTLKDPNKPDEWDLAQYSGVLLGKVGEAELTIDNYNGNERNEVKQWICKVDSCPTRFPKIRHKTDLRGKK
jgi:hypothetical protein